MSAPRIYRLAIFRVIVFSLVCAIAAGTGQTIAQTDAPADPAADTAETAAAGDDLSVEQGRLADRYERLEQIITQLAELTAATDPYRAKLLREALAQARERDVAIRFDAVVHLLEDGRLATASRNQTELSRRSQLTVLLTWSW